MTIEYTVMMIIQSGTLLGTTADIFGGIISPRSSRTAVSFCKDKGLGKVGLMDTSMGLETNSLWWVGTITIGLVETVELLFRAETLEMVSGRTSRFSWLVMSLLV